MTPATEDLLKPPSFIAEDLAFLDQVLEGDACRATTPWSSLVVCERAVLDPERAWKEMMALQTVDGGASKAALLYWIAACRLQMPRPRRSWRRRKRAGNLFRCVYGWGRTGGVLCFSHKNTGARRRLHPTSAASW